MKLPQLSYKLTLDEISLVPSNFSEIKSRADVNPHINLFGQKKLPIISSNMDSVYSPELSQQTLSYQGISIVHRFCSIEDNIKLFTNGCALQGQPWVSIGSALNEFERAEALVNAGADVLVIDLAMGNSINAIEQYNRLRTKYGSAVAIIVSDFSTSKQLRTFNSLTQLLPDGFTLGQGSGSSCRTRLTTGIGIPSASMIDDCASYIKTTGQKLILNGGIKDTQDMCKAIALGCDAVIIGRLFAACEESGAVTSQSNGKVEKIYRGSASASSYEAQGKTAFWRAPEGEEFKIKVTGTVRDLIRKLEGGLRSSMSYLNAIDIKTYQNNAEFVIISSNGITEASAFGKNIG